jgi:hypothetical protein
MVVYLITNLINGKDYVGQTIRSISWRFSQHKSSARRGDNLALCRAIVSAETRQRLRNSHLGHIPWNKGKSGYKIK